MSASVPTRGSVRAALSEVAPRYDIAKVYLFGSVARGCATPQSDVDLCLVTGPSFSLFNAGSFAHSMQEALGSTVDIVTESTLYPHVRESMLKDRLLAYER